MPAGFTKFARVSLIFCDLFMTSAVISSFAHMCDSSVPSSPLALRGKRYASIYLFQSVLSAAADVISTRINCCGLPNLSSAVMVDRFEILKKLSAESIVVLTVIFFVRERPSASYIRFSLKRNVRDLSVISIGSVLIIAVRIYRSIFTSKFNRLPPRRIETLSAKSRV